jgi:hypothetical protein
MSTRLIICTFADPQYGCFGVSVSLSYFHSNIFDISTVHTHVTIRGDSAAWECWHTYKTSTAELVMILITSVIRNASTFWRGLWCVLTWRRILGFIQNMLWFDLSVCFTYIYDSDLQITSLSIIFTFSPCIFNNRHNVRLMHLIYRMQSV